ncbi:MAG: hypothetical protein JWP96_1875 [Polaromonas sp.]|nr:hypothetical protein [Polaromonas sp.]
MNITQRTCANCAAFNPAPEVDEPACWNLVSFNARPGTPPALSREPGPADLCDSHQTHEEDKAEDAALVDPATVHRKH